MRAPLELIAIAFAIAFAYGYAHNVSNLLDQGAGQIRASMELPNAK